MKVCATRHSFAFNDCTIRHAHRLYYLKWVQAVTKEDMPLSRTFPIPACAPRRTAFGMPGELYLFRLKDGDSKQPLLKCVRCVAAS